MQLCEGKAGDRDPQTDPAIGFVTMIIPRPFQNAQ
jgi:hypothetical protein